MSAVAEVDAPFAPLKPDEIVPVATPASAVPAIAPPEPGTPFELGRPSGRWTYHDKAGGALFKMLRFDKPDGDKEFRPLTLWRETQGLRWL